MNQELQKLILASPSLSPEAKKELLARLPFLSEEQQEALKKVFVEEKSEYEKIEAHVVEAWQSFSKNLGVIAEEICKTG